MSVTPILLSNTRIIDRDRNNYQDANKVTHTNGCATATAAHSCSRNAKSMYNIMYEVVFTMLRYLRFLRVFG